MDKKNLEQVLNTFIKRYEEIDNPSGNNEGYKWLAVANFQKYWDIEAIDFPQMFADAMSATSNLIDNATVQPIGGIKMLLSHEEEVEFVREAFNELFSDDKGDLEERNERINDFMEKINGRIDHYVSGSWKFPQSRSSVIYYLNLWRPEENYIFKSTEATEWANCIEFGGDFGSGTTFSLAEYYRMCEELLLEIKGMKEFQEFEKSRIERAKKETDINVHSNMHIMVYDIIYCAHAYSFYSDMSIVKTSTKDRIKRAESRGKKEAIEQEIIEKQTEKDNLESQIVSIEIKPGQSVIHKKYGSGQVKTVDAGHIIVSYSNEDRTFQYPNAFEMGFLKVEDDDTMGAFVNNAKILKDISVIESAIKALEAQL